MQPDYDDQRIEYLISLEEEKVATERETDELFKNNCDGVRVKRRGTQENTKRNIVL